MRDWLHLNGPALLSWLLFVCCIGSFVCFCRGFEAVEVVWATALLFVVAAVVSTLNDLEFSRHAVILFVTQSNCDVEWRLWKWQNVAISNAVNVCGEVEVAMPSTSCSNS